MQTSATRSGALSINGHSTWIAAKMSDVIADKLQRHLLVEKAEISGTGIVSDERESCGNIIFFAQFIWQSVNKLVLKLVLDTWVYVIRLIHVGNELLHI